VLSLRISRDKRGYDHIYLLLETRRKGRTVTRLLYGGRWPSPMKIGQQPLDEAMRKTLEQAYPEVTFDWVALQRTLQQALATPRAPMTPETRRRSAAGRGGEGRPASSGPGGGGTGGPGGLGGPGGRQQQGPGRVPPASRSQMPPRQRPPYAPYAPGFGDQGDQGEQQRAYPRRDSRDPRDPRDQRELRDSRPEHDPELREPFDEMPDARDEMTSVDDTADLPFHEIHEIIGAEPDADVVDLPGQPYDEPVLEEGLETLARRGGLSEIRVGPEEIEPVEERTFVVSTDDDDTGEHALAADEPADDRSESDRTPEFERAARIEPATFERPELPGAGFTRDEFPVAADSVTPGPTAGFTPGAPDAPADPNAPPRRRRRRRRGGRRSHGGPNAPSQPGSGPSSEAGNEPDDTASGPEDHDDDSDV
jgi:hypothetical protein